MGRRYNVDKMSDSYVLDVARLLSKRANQRLRQLEQSGLTKSSAAYRAVETFQRDGRDFIKTTGAGEVKFNTNFAKMSIEQAREELEQLDIFLNGSHTSTVRGVRKHYEESYKAFIKSDELKEKFAGDPNAPRWEDMTREEYINMWTDTVVKNLVNMYGSEQAIQLTTSAGNSIAAQTAILERLKDIDENTSFTKALRIAKEAARAYEDEKKGDKPNKREKKLQRWDG